MSVFKSRFALNHFVISFVSVAILQLDLCKNILNIFLLSKDRFFSGQLNTRRESFSFEKKIEETTNCSKFTEENIKSSPGFAICLNFSIVSRK